MPVVILQNHVVTQVMHCLQCTLRVPKPFNLVHQVFAGAFGYWTWATTLYTSYRFGTSSLFNSSGTSLMNEGSFMRSDAGVTGIDPSGVGRVPLGR